jgi:hypothetical protein
MSYRSTVLKIAIHPEEADPLLGTSALVISLEDDGAGPYVVLEDLDHDANACGVTLDLDEVQQLVLAVNFLLMQPAFLGEEDEEDEDEEEDGE